MTRTADIKDKIAYAEKRRNSLMDEMFRAKKENVEPTFIAHTAGEILSVSRECYDYCGQDIIEDIIIPGTKNTSLKKMYNSGKIRAYFPLYKNQLLKSNSIFSELKTINRNLHNHLFSLTSRMQKNETMPNTLFRYGDVLTIKDMVNEKKHDKLTAIVSDKDMEYLIENENMTMIIPIKDQVGWNRFSVQEGSNVQRVAEFRFEYNDKEVGKFCMLATKMTERIMDEIYKNFFGCAIIDG